MKPDHHSPPTAFRLLLSQTQVILSGGAIDSPKLLLLSGIGPEEDLKALGISPVANRPGVGSNLQDHPAVGRAFM